MSHESYLTPEEVRALKLAFYAQAREMLQDFGERVLDLERSDEGRDVVRSLERTVHTVKGDSMALEFEALAKLAHRLEDYLRSLRGATSLDREAIDLLLASGDRMSALVEAYCADPPGEIPEIESLCELLVPLNESHDTRETSLEAPFYRLTVWFASDCTMHSAGALLVRQRLSALAQVVGAEPDPDTTAIEETSKWTVTVASEAAPKDLRRAARVPGVTSRVSVARAPSRGFPAAGARSEPGASEGGVPASSPRVSTAGGGVSEQLRVEIAKIDRIMNYVGELVIGRSMVAQLLAELESACSLDSARDRLSEANGFLERTLSDLQAAVLKIRMVPVDHVFRRLPRLVRDLAHSKGKEVDLVIDGGLTEIDKSIVDALGEPLLHLVRNAVDHGIEAPEERVGRGKPRAGRLSLSAFYEGNHAHVVVEDDGRGIDVAEVARRAVSLGLLVPEQLDELTPSEILNAIYEPGFSTRETVSDVSGRGIGMDVVRASIENLKGIIELSTAPGQGTRFLIRLPLTLAILRAVLVEVSGRAFAIPLTSVLEIVRLHKSEAKSILGKSALHWRDQVVPLVSLREALGTVEEPSASGEGGFVLLVGEAERRVGLVAERLLGEQELVVKPIEDGLARSPGIAGASILGNGRLVLILHVRSLLDGRVSVSRKVEVLS